MNTLSTNSIYKALHGFKDFRSAIEALSELEENSSLEVAGLKGALKGYFFREYIFYLNEKMPEKEKKLLVVVPSEREAQALKGDLNTVFPEAEVSVLPGWGTLCYSAVTPNSLIFGQRAGVFSRMAHNSPRSRFKNSLEAEIFIVPLKVFLTPTPPPEYIKNVGFSFEKGMTIDTMSVSEKLSAIGYTRVPRVSVRGEFSLRGEVLDIFLPDEELACRIIFDFEKIEQIRTFDVAGQNTVSSIESVLIYPMKEVIWDETLSSVLKKKLSDTENEIFQDAALPRLSFTDEAKEAGKRIFDSLDYCNTFEGEEFFYPSLWDKAYSVLDFFDSSLPVFFMDFDRLENLSQSIEKEYSGLYRKNRLDFPVLPPEDISFSLENMVKKVSRCMKLRTILSENSSFLKISSDFSQSYFGNFSLLRTELESVLKKGWDVFIFADNENQAFRISEILKDFVHPADKNLKPLVIVGKSISEGFVIPELKLKVIQENEIFSRKKYVPKTSHRVKSEVIDTFVELNPGDYVVHVNYGIGIFLGIERVRSVGHERDYIKLEYADKDFLFVPIEQVNLVQRYIGNDGDSPQLDRIGSKAWEERKAKVKKAVEEIAEKLIGLYSRRKASAGFPFPKDTEWQTAFEAAFLYEDTPDQITVTEEVKKDMEKPLPMDRLICGDVGYGKTEIAMRAAFKAVMGGKQVAFLAPTTILSEQHYETCVERFRNFPVKIAQLSRFVSQSKQKEILDLLANGKVDILVGTHRIIQKDVVFKNLGLMIIDEEQRFGVKDKEKLKFLRANIDSLAMSATPIPRTLHMSLLKIRDMSLLTTPPQNRRPIETVIDSFSDERISKAIRREVERGGQVFYLHNRVETLAETRVMLERLMPEMTVEVAHGKMTSDVLDDIFRRFKMGGFHILVSTTIIENGIDIPNVNTIIIDRADMYGVSQLYQLRGRVGRSDRKAYAYLLYPGDKALSEIAMKRLQVISDFTELGSGFKIAMKDLEIRGAGNLLGKDQSGNVYSVGFDMYMKLLNEAIAALTEKEDFSREAEVLLELEYTGFIPDFYIKNPEIKMEIYKKIASVISSDELDSVYSELDDRFGPVPDEILSLLSLAEIRVLCKKLHVSKIKELKGCAAVEFTRISDINVDKVIKLLTESDGTVRLDSKKPNVLYLNTGNIALKEKSEFIKEKLERIV